jgi:hypothetical protein
LKYTPKKERICTEKEDRTRIPSDKISIENIGVLPLAMRKR